MREFRRIQHGNAIAEDLGTMLMILGPFTVTQTVLALFAAFGLGLGASVGRRRHAEPHNPDAEYRKLEERIRHPWKSRLRSLLNR